MVRRGRRRVRIVRLATLLALGAALFAAVGGPSAADVTAVSGSAFGATGNVRLFGGTPNVLAATPTVTLPATGEVQNASVPSIVFTAGPADLLTTGAADVSTQGTLGAGGSVTSTATVQNVVVGGTTVTTLSSTCTADETGVRGSTTVTGGRVPTGDTDRSTEGDETYTDVPANPAVAATFNGLVPSVETDYYRVVFNEQIVSGSTITVNAAHFFLGENPPAQNGPVATGEVIVGQVVCGVTATGPGSTTTTVAGGTTTTVAGGTTTTVAGGTTTTVAGGTTTTRPGATTTTRPGATTTTAVAATTSPGGGGGSGGSSSGTSGVLARTGSSFQSLIVLSLLTLVVGALTLIGFGTRAVPARPGAGRAHPAAAWRRSRRPWGRRGWF